MTVNEWEERHKITSTINPKKDRKAKQGIKKNKQKTQYKLSEISTNI